MSNKALSGSFFCFPAHHGSALASDKYQIIELSSNDGDQNEGLDPGRISESLLPRLCPFKLRSEANSLYFIVTQDHLMSDTAYVIGHISVKDPVKWAEYRSLVPGTLAPWGAELVLRGQLARVLAGEHPFTNAVVIRFPDLAAVNNWYASPAYQALIPLRTEAADLALLVYEA